jgi:hypothetical protein
MLHGVKGVNQAKPCKLGDTSVRIRQYASDRRFAIATCGRALWRASHVEDEDSLQYVLENIWITDQNDVSVSNLRVDLLLLKIC